LSDYFTEGSLATVQALAAAVDAKDPYTKGHSQRVASLARSLAVRMGGSEAFIDQVYAAGTLHDVGKIGVPDAILAKPSQLTKEESMVMATHPVLGEVIVAKVPQLASLLPGVRHHHERWDGAGYPDGLSGEGIPLQARYLAVADTFDAMTTDRPYRKALSDQVALAEIERCAGTQFQPELAKEFVRMMRDLITVAGESVDSRTHAS
jgi:HD-GYP domain-containing protein (c-di-GMP phosphodiesterase class II)